MAQVSRSWWTVNGRRRIAGLLFARAYELVRVASATSERPKMVTLTCAKVEDWERCQGALRGFLNALRTWSSRLGYRVSYVWSLEIQDRGALHYHVVLVNCPFLDKERVSSWWGLGFIKVQAVETERALKYALKYAAKCATTEGADVDEESRARLDTMLVLSSANKQRRHGATRDITTATRRIPGWVVEVCQACEWEPRVVTWRLLESGRGEVTWDGETVYVEQVLGRWLIVGGAYNPDSGQWEPPKLYHADGSPFEVR